MKANFKVNQNLIIEIEAETQKDLFRELASIAEVFGEKCCGVCGGTEIVRYWRTPTSGKKTFEYPEYHCVTPNQHGVPCMAKLAMGIMNDGSGRLFPNRKLLPNGQPATGDNREKGKHGPHKGWTRYRGEDRSEPQNGEGNHANA